MIMHWEVFKYSPNPRDLKEGNGMDETDSGDRQN